MNLLHSPSRVEMWDELCRARLAAAAPDPCRDDLALWSEQKLQFDNPPHLVEWYTLIQKHPVLCIIAPRDHAKTQTLTINNVAWRTIHNPGYEAVVFAATDDVAIKLKERIDKTIRAVAPELLLKCPTRNDHETKLNNEAVIIAAGAGKAVRSAHPDLIIGDDVLEEDKCRTAAGREKTESWWSGTVEGMRHSGQTPRLVGAKTHTYPPTRLVLCGTPFHQEDLLMAKRHNPMYFWARYVAEARPEDYVGGMLAVECNRVERRVAA